MNARNEVLNERRKVTTLRFVLKDRRRMRRPKLVDKSLDKLFGSQGFVAKFSGGIKGVSYV